MSSSLTFLGSSDDEKSVVIQMSDSVSSESDKIYNSVVVTDNAIEKIDIKNAQVSM